MAKCIGIPPFIGTRNGLTVYKLPDGIYYVRQQSSITAKRIRKDKAFEKFRESAGRMAVASKIASAVYKQLPEREYPMYREMTGKAILMLKQGYREDEVMAMLEKEYLPVPVLPIKKPALYYWQSARLVWGIPGDSMRLSTG